MLVNPTAAALGLLTHGGTAAVTPGRSCTTSATKSVAVPEGPVTPATTATSATFHPTLGPSWSATTSAKQRNVAVNLSSAATTAKSTGNPAVIAGNIVAATVVEEVMIGDDSLETSSRGIAGWIVKNSVAGRH